MTDSSKQVRLPVVLNWSIKSTGKGKKRDTVEKQLISSKKQKTVDNTGDAVAHPTVDKLKFVAMKQENGEENKDDQISAKTENFFVPPDFVPVSPFPPLEGGTKLVFVDNLHPDVKESDVIEFFKDVGKIDRVTFFGTKFAGCGDIRFETSEAAQKALKRNGKVLIDRPVTLVPSEERTRFDFFTPSDEQTYLFMGNLSLSVEKNDIVKFFKNDGKIVSLRIMSEDYPFKGDKSVAHVKFDSAAEAYKAYRRYGQMLHGRPVEFALATEKSVWYSCTPSSRWPRMGLFVV